jgi:hypothetical protein
MRLPSVLIQSCFGQVNNKKQRTRYAGVQQQEKTLLEFDERVVELASLTVTAKKLGKLVSGRLRHLHKT